jgi:Fe-S cluster assembly protein SufD
VKTPIHLLFLGVPGGGPVAAHMRNLFVVEENAQATIVETYSGEGVYFTNGVTEIALDQDANLDHYKIQIESEEACHVATQQLEQAGPSVFTSHNISFGGALVRNDINSRLGGEHIESTINGLYVVNGRQHVDNHTAIDHAVPNCNSHELYKGIMDGRSTGVFNGKIFVRQDAQKTDAKQTNQNLLLSEDAVIDTKPQLEIYADDVRCTHGATVGQLDADSLFYLRSRGIGLAEARAMLVHAFASDVLNRIKLEDLRERLEEALLRKLGS